MKMLFNNYGIPFGLALLMGVSMTSGCRGPEDDGPETPQEQTESTPAPSTQAPKNDESGLPRNPAKGNEPLAPAQPLGQGNNNGDLKKVEPTNSPTAIPEVPLLDSLVIAALKKISHSEKETGSLFPLARGMHEMSYGGIRLTSLEAAAIKGEALIQVAYLDIKVSEQEVVLNLKRNYTFSFSRYSDGKKIKILCNGFDLKLVGENFENVFVDARTANGKKSSVVLVSSGKIMPTIDLRGEEGKRGADAVCPAGFESCLSDNPAQFPAAIAEIESYEDSRVTTEPISTVRNAEQIFAFIGAFTEGAQPTFSYPRPDAIDNEKVVMADATGTVECRTTWTGHRFKDGSARAGRDGIGIAAQPGTDGASGGTFIGHAFEDSLAISAQNLEGGKGGNAGVSGVVLPGRGSAQTAFEEKQSEKRFLRDAKIVWRFTATAIHYDRPVFGVVIPQKSPLEVYADGAFNSSEWENPEHTPIRFDLPAGPDGATAGRPTAAPGKKGEDGTAQFHKVEKLDDFLKLTGDDISLPSDIAHKMEEMVKAGVLL